MRPPAALLALALAGCGSFTYRTTEQYDPGGASAELYQREGAQCEMAAYQSRSSQGFGGLAGAANMVDSFNTVFDACMRAKGYRRLSK